jgi:hypothetical protein
MDLNDSIYNYFPCRSPKDTLKQWQWINGKTCGGHPLMDHKRENSSQQSGTD